MTCCLRELPFRPPDLIKYKMARKSGTDFFLNTLYIIFEEIKDTTELFNHCCVIKMKNLLINFLINF